MRGTFTLSLIEENPLYSHYVLTNIAFTAGWAGNEYRVDGQGEYELGGEVALRQTLVLSVQVSNSVAKSSCYLTNTVATPERPWPMVVVDADQTNKTVIQFYRMQLVSAPLQEIWFSMPNGLHSGNWQPPTNFVGGGDLVSSTGRVVKRNTDLTARLGIMPAVPDLGLDAVDLLPGGEVAFSIEEDVFSETLGPLHHGDVLSNGGRSVARYSDLITSFSPEPPAPDVGLDAVQLQESGTVLFSIETNVFSEKLGVTLQRGDVLSNSGQIVRRNADLLARFHPADPRQDYGLDALYVWPSGEVWFSTETGFQDALLGGVMGGDLLTDLGAVVYRNLELTSAFAPLEDLFDFGLDALYVVTDASPPAPAPRIVSVTRDPATGGVVVQCDGKGRAFQLERAADLRGPWLPASPIVPELRFEDFADPPDVSAAFYRVRQW